MLICVKTHSNDVSSCKNRKYYTCRIDTERTRIGILELVSSSWSPDDINFPIDISYQDPMFDSRCRKGFKSRVRKMMSCISWSISSREKMLASTFISRQNQGSWAYYRLNNTQNKGDTAYQIYEKLTWASIG